MKRKYICSIGFLIFIAAACMFICGCSREPVTLADPQNLHVDGITLKWDGVENASGYAILYDNKETETKECAFLLNELTEQRKYRIKVLAIGDGKNYADSKFVDFVYTPPKIVENGYDENGLLYVLLADKSGYEVRRGKHALEPNTVVNIPDYFTCLPVKRIAEDGFTALSFTDVDPHIGVGCNSMFVQVNLPSTLEEIGCGAFAGLVNVTEFIIPESVTEIESSAFYGCARLNKINIPEGIKTIENGTFGDCALTEIVLPQSLEYIGGSAFRCLYVDWALIKHTDPSVTDLVIPDSVKEIGNAAFWGLRRLENVTLPSGLQSMGMNVFYDTAWLNSSNGFATLGDVLVGYFGDEKNIIIPETVNSVACKAFGRQKTVEKVEFLHKVNYLGDSTFISCNALKTVKLSSDFTGICSKMFFACSSLSDISIPDAVTEIGYRAFYMCEGLEVLKLPSGLKIIGEQAFSKSGLKQIVIPHSVETLEQLAFGECEALAAIFYEGSEKEWGKLKSEHNEYIKTMNGWVVLEKPFSDASIYYYSEVAPVSDGNEYWHYVDGNPTVWE